MNKHLEQQLGKPASTTASLTTENQQLRNQLQELLTQAHNNQRIMHRHHSLNLKLISSNGLLELFDAIFSDLKQSSVLDRVTLMVFDPEYELHRILNTLNMHAAALPHVLLQQNPANLSAEYRTLRKPQLGRFSPKQHALFFPEPHPPASIAIMPLHRQNHLIGFLNFGSHNATRFVSNVATDFIEEQAAIIAICLENAVNTEKLKHIGLTDPLTGIHNRRYIESRLLEEIRRAQRQDYALSCMYIDIDHFKQINDSHGHQFGDEVLREVAARIRSELRLSDACGRFGGEEFIVLLNDTNATGAKHVAERIRASIASRSFKLCTGNTCQVTVSIGVSTLSLSEDNQTPGTIAQDFVSRADFALYQAKNSGRNQVVFLD